MTATVIRTANVVPTITKAGKVTTYRNVGSERGEHATIETGRVVLWGTTRRCVAGLPGVHLKAYRTEFKIGDVAVYGGYNLTYTGKIVAITAKTVTVEAYSGTCNARRYRMTVERFNRWNSNFDLAAIQQRNSEWMD